MTEAGHETCKPILDVHLMMERLQVRTCARTHTMGSHSEEPNHASQHSVEEPLLVRCLCLEVWAHIHFHQRWCAMLAKHEVKSHKLKKMLSAS